MEVEVTKPKFSINLEQVQTEPVHSLSEAEKEILSGRFKELKRKVDAEGYALTLEDMRVVVQWLRADRETKFILNQKPVKEVKAPKEKVVKVKAPKKLSQKALGLIYLKELNGELLTEEEQRNKDFTLGGV